MILFVLKIIGIVLLIILAVLILLLGVILFVPVRYYFDGEYEKSLSAEGLVKWSPVFLKVTANYRNGKLEYIIKMFGGVIKTNQDIPLSWIGRKFFASKEEMGEEDDENSEYIDNINFQKEPLKNELNNESDRLETRRLTKQKRIIKKKKTSIFDKIRKKLDDIKKRIKQFIAKLKKINEKREALLKVYRSKRFDVAKNDAIIYLKELLVIIKPQKAEGYVRFGFEDPATTGQVLGIVAMFLSVYDDFLQIQPDFERTCLKADLNGKGKIYLFSVAKLVIKIMLNKNLIKVIKKVQTIIEA